MEKNGKLMENKKQWFRGQKSYFPFKKESNMKPCKWKGGHLAAILASSVGVCQPNR